MRVSAQNSRRGSAKHNDRKFDLDKATHIDLDRSKDNIFISWRGRQSESFEADELLYYEQNFRFALDEKNSKAVRQGHAERVKTMAEFLSSKKTCPEESIYQIGDKDTHATHDQLLRCYQKFLSFQLNWSREHGDPFKVLNSALHMDEVSPHVHQRRVWQYHDPEGKLQVGQEKALKEAGIELPDPQSPEGRYNNRKMTFDKIMREKWLDICQEQGLDIERVPLCDGRHHLDKEDFIRQKQKDLLKETDRLIEKHDALVDIITELQKDNLKIAKGVIEKYERYNHERSR